MKIEGMKAETAMLLAVMAAVGLYVWKRGGIAGALAGAGGAVLGVAQDAAVGGMDAVSSVIGLPGPSETTTDPYVARWMIDVFGYWTASQWAGAPALVQGAQLPHGSGYPPPAGSAAYAALWPRAQEQEREAQQAAANSAAVYDRFAGNDWTDYTAAYNKRAAAIGAPQAVTGSGGAAFGMYARP